MKLSFKKGHLLAKRGTSPGRSNVFPTHPNVKVILWDFLGQNWLLIVIEGEEG
jgi:hypothetical protein